MEITLAEILHGKKGIEKILNSDLPIRTSYRLSKLIDQLNEEYIKINEAQRKIMKKYGEEKKDGTITIEPKNQKKVQEEFDEFLAEKTKINFEPINIDELGEAKLSPMEIKSMAAFFTE